MPHDGGTPRRCDVSHVAAQAYAAIVRIRASRLVLLIGIAGVVLAHLVDYLAVFPNGAVRAHELQATGHAYWPVALLLGRAQSWSLPADAPVFAAWIVHVDPRGPPRPART